MKALRFLLPLLLGGLLTSAADRELAGSVVDANTGEPIARAHLTVRFMQAGQPAPEVTMLSDADGTFRMTNVPDGQYQVSCDKAGYLPANQMMAAMPPAASPDGKRTATMVLKLTAQAAVEGTLVDDRDMPAPNTFVQMVHQQVVNGRRQYQIAGNGNTDETGYFRIFGLPAGRYYLSISARLRGAKASKPLAYPRLYYPGALDLATAQPIELKAGDNSEIKMQLPAPVPAFEVRGAIVTASPGFGVNLVPQSSDSNFQQSSGDISVDPKTKTFKISHVTPGIYMLTASASQDGKNAFATTMITVASADVTGLRLEPVEVSLDGTVRTDGDAAPQRTSGFVVGTDGDAGSRRMSGFVSVQSDHNNNGGQVDPEGKFHIPNIQPGTYRVIPQLNGLQSCVRSILSGGRDVRDGLTVAPGAAPDPIEVVMTSHCGTVDVSVAPSDSPPPQNLAAYVLRKAGDELVLEKQGYSTFDGPRTNHGSHFTIQGVAPGDYMVYVWPLDLQIEYANAEYMKQYESYGQRVTVTEDGKAAVSLDKALMTLIKN